MALRYPICARRVRSYRVSSGRLLEKKTILQTLAQRVAAVAYKRFHPQAAQAPYAVVGC